VKQTDILADDKGRINLGIGLAKQRFILIEESETRLVLEKATLIPERELWLHKNNSAKESVITGLEQARAGLLKKNAIDLDDNEDDKD